MDKVEGISGGCVAHLFHLLALGSSRAICLAVSVGTTGHSLVPSLLHLPFMYLYATLKVMPPIYFHENNNRYKEHNHTI